MSCTSLRSTCGRRWVFVAAVVASGALLGARAGLAAEPMLLEAGGLSAEAAALLLSGQQGGDVPVRPLVLPVSEEGAGGSTGGSARALLVEIDGAALLAGAEEAPVDIELSSYFLDASGVVAAALLDVVRLPDDAAVGKVRLGGLKYVALAEVEAGSYDLRLLVRNLQTGALGLRAEEVELVDLSQVELLPPLVAERSAAWMLAAGNSARAVHVGGLAAVEVATFPVVPAGDRVAIGLVAGETISRDELVLELLDGERVVSEVRPEWSDEDSTQRAGAIRSTLNLDGLPAGEFRMRWRAGVLTSSAALPVVSVAGLGEERPIWPELGRATGVPPATRTDGPQPKKLAVPPAEIAERLTAALRLVAEGEGRAAAARLIELERAALAGNGALIEPLGRVEFRLLRRLGADDIESLVPVLQLYLEAYRESRAAREYLISTHQRTMVEVLSDHYASSARTAEAARIAASALVRLVSELGDGPGPSTEHLLRAALELEPGLEAALLALAHGFERRGLYDEARRKLQELVDLHPGHEEARLRLALQQLRLGERGGAAILEELAWGAGEVWVRELAQQELVRWLLDRDELVRASAVVERARSEFPDSQKLAILAAFLAALDGAAAKTGESLDLPLAAGAPIESARVRYGRLETAAFERLGDQLAGGAAARFAALSRIVGPVEATR